MPMTLNKKEAERRVSKVNEALRAGFKPPDQTLRTGEIGAVSRAADALKLKRNAMRMSLANIKVDYNLEPDWSLYVVPTVDEQIAAAQQRDVVEQLRSQLEKLERELANITTMREHVFDLADLDTTPPSWIVPTTKPATMTGVPLLQVTDLQCGEVIDARELDGINGYDLKEFERRYRRMIERTIDICFNHMVNPKYPGVVYLRGGDMVHGDVLRVENRATNEKGVLACMTVLVRCERWGIEQLADRFGKVLIITTPGNHGRTTVKPESKRASEENYDTLSAYMLENAFEGDDRVKFNTPAGVDVVQEIMGWVFLMTHGDRIGSKGGQGFVGPAATISRGMKKLIDYYAALKVMVDYIMIGHYHEPLELEYGWSGGSGPGYSEFARDLRARPKQAKQWLLFVHPKYGVTCRWQVFLSDPPRRTIGSNDAFKW